MRVFHQYFGALLIFTVRGNTENDTKSLDNVIDELKYLRQVVEDQSVHNAVFEKKIEELQKVVKDQETQINELNFLLKRKANEEPIKKVVRVFDKKNAQNLNKLKSSFFGILRKTIKSCQCLKTSINGHKAHSLSIQTPKRVNGFQMTDALFRKGRITPPQTHSDAVAFYAYMSSTMSGIGSHHKLVFDVIETNVGNGYHQHTGVFSVPKTGLYVFSWSIRIGPNSYHSVELVVNGNVKGMVYQHTSDNAYTFDQGGTTVVLSINAGDDVYLRTNVDYNKGSIFSTDYGRTSFAGWKI